MTGECFVLEPGERVLWQACPAPRAYVFRRWRLSLVCLPVWLWMSFQWSRLWVAEGVFGWQAALWVLAGWGAVGHLLAARLSWRGERYLLTDRWLRVRKAWQGWRLQRWPLDEVETDRVVSMSGSVETVRLRSRRNGKLLTLHCLEEAGALLRALEGGEIR